MITNTCNGCEADLTNNSSLLDHNKNKKATYSCNECKCMKGDKSILKTHKQYKHGEVKYYCDKCEYRHKTQENLS